MAVAVQLTALAHGAGCGCKLPAAALLPIVRALPGTADYAAVFALGERPRAAALRGGDPAVIVRVREGRVLLDLRTLTDDEAREAARGVRATRA